MLEDQVANLLQRYFGNYVRGLNKEALKISVWRGDVELKNMQLKPEALNALKLPVKVKAGFLGSMRLQVPWNRLGQDPVVVFLDHIYLLVEPATETGGNFNEDLQEAKRNRIRETEMKLLERTQKSTPEESQSWLGSLINTIIGNIKLSISNMHIRYEDPESNPGHPFAVGVELKKLSAFTVDDSGIETFVSGGSLDHIQKLLELDQLSFYLDSDVTLWRLNTQWEDLLPDEWTQIFMFGTVEGRPASQSLRKHCYALQPVSGNAKYIKNQVTDADNEGQKLIVMLDDVTLCISKNGYRDALKLADNFAAFNQRLKYAHFRPTVAIKSNARPWWIYAYRAVADQISKGSGKVFWDQILRYSRMRKRYISLYASLLISDMNKSTVDNNLEIQEMDQDLATDLILEWRMMAHKFVEQSLESEMYLRKKSAKKSWWPFGGSTQSPNDENEQLGFTDEDWKQLNRIIGYKEGTETNSSPQQKQDAVTFMEIQMNHNATKLLSETYECIAELSCNQLDCFGKLYPETKIFGAKLGSYQLSSPFGLLAKSADKVESLSCVVSYKPFEAKVDWSMVLKASPCYITYLKDSIDEIANFFSSDALSQTIAMETAAAVQTTIDEVKRTAQKQVNRALKDQTRFLLDLDIAAPKLRIPTSFAPDNANSTNLFVDLGKLKIYSRDSEELEDYVQFDLVLSDISAFLFDGDYQWDDALSDSLINSSRRGLYFPLIDNCGIILRFQQNRLEDSSKPSSRLSARLPSLSFHFSPALYHRLLNVVKVFHAKNKNSESFRPWEQANFEGQLSILTRKGIGNRDAIWSSRYVCLVGVFVYILAERGSQSYERYISLRGKTIHQLPPELVGGVQNLVAILHSGYKINKAVEDTTAIIFRCDSEESQRNWYNRLRETTYLYSGYVPIAAASDSSSESDGTGNDVLDFDDSDSFYKESFFFTGILDQLKLLVTYNSYHDGNLKTVLLAKESRLFELRAIGGQVELSIRENDLFIGTILNTLEIEDLFSCDKASETCYLARSFISSVDSLSPMNSDADDEDDDNFYEAAENLFESEISCEDKLLFNTLPPFSRAIDLLPEVNLHYRKSDNEGSKPIGSFFKAQVQIYDQNSSMHNNVDMQVHVTVATVSVFCRRPTLLAVLDFTSAINISSVANKGEDNPLPSVPEIKPDEDEIVVLDESMGTEPAIKGFLGKGKSRVIFSLVLEMNRVQVLLLLECGSRLATLSQNNLFTNIKVFPSSFSIASSLGNLKISDDGLDDKHPYFWMCDNRNPGGSSLVDLTFTSFNEEDDDYENFEYSLCGQLSEVRIVYLSRFLQEIVNYFMALVPKSSRDVVKLRDQKTNSDKLFSAADVEGSTALKLDLSLTKPIIIIPRNTDSKEYLQLDVVHMTVRNQFQWLSGTKEDVQATRLEILTIEVKDINLNVGFDLEISESIIQDVEGLSVLIRRSLRDLLHQIPSLEAAIAVDKLRASLSNKDYQIITECAISNISEKPRTIPDLKVEPQTIISEVIENVLHRDSGNVLSDSRSNDVWISMVVTLAVNLVELSLYTGDNRDKSLATMQINGLWLLYRTDNLSEGMLSATLKEFSVVDDREGIASEFKLAIGKLRNNVGYFPISDDRKENLDAKGEHSIYPASVMLVLDVKLSKYSTVISLCVQRPQLLVVLDFLLAFAEFFVPNIDRILSKENGKEPVDLFNAVIVDEPVYTQPSAVVSLSPRTPLIVEHETYDHFIYDGNGGTLHLRDKGGLSLTVPAKEPLIFVGHGKTLHFKNVTIKEGKFLDSCIWLGTSSGYIALEQDGVLLERDDGTTELSNQETSNRAMSNAMTANNQNEYIFELQAIGPELAFYNTSKNLVLSPVISNKLLYAQFNAYARLSIKGDNIEATAQLLGFLLESNGIKVVEPFDTLMKYSNASGKIRMKISLSDVCMSCPFSILKLFIAVEEDIMTFLQRTSQEITVPCSQFDRIGTIKNTVSDQIYSFWRPVVPTGFAILGDCLTPLDKPPTTTVVAVNKNVAKVKIPIAYHLVWPVSNDEIEASIDGDTRMESKECFIWYPEAPKGYVAMGCVVTSERKPPPPSFSVCISSSMVSPCSWHDCVTIKLNGSSTLAFWRVSNSVGSFLPADPESLAPLNRPYELRHIKYAFTEYSHMTDTLYSSQNHEDLSLSVQSSSLRESQRFRSTINFQLVWWNRDSNSQKRISIWRPVIPSGMIFLGDVAVKGYEPPSHSLVLEDCRDEEKFKSPVGYKLIKHLKKQGGAENICFWMPIAPPGFVSLGCVACKGSLKQNDLSQLRCIRSDMAVQDQFSEETLFDTSDPKVGSEAFSLWTVENEIGTFVACCGYKKPPRRLGLKLADCSDHAASDDILVDAEISSFSAALYDDYGGLMVPLLNPSVSEVKFSMHGRSNYLVATVNGSISAKSFNDKYNVWEPIIEPFNGFLRYQYDPKSPLAPTQLRLTSTGNLNVNFSVSNINMVLQAYANWIMLTSENFKKSDKKFETSKSIIDIRNQSKFYILPSNKLGRDIFMRVVETEEQFHIINMAKGDIKPVKVPVLKNMFDPDWTGKSVQNCRKLMTVAVVDAQLPVISGLTSKIFVVSILLFSSSNHSVESLISRQSARTSGGISVLSSDCEIVTWNEMFFFNAEDQLNYSLHLIVTDIQKGIVVGEFSCPLNELAIDSANSSRGFCKNAFNWVDLEPPKVSGVDELDEYGNFKGRIRFSVHFPQENETGELKNVGENSGIMQISPTFDGPWTTVRLNYSAPASCWRFGNTVVASEVVVTDEFTYLNIRSLVSVRNCTSFTFELLLVPRSSTDISTSNLTTHYENSNTSPTVGTIFNVQEFIEFEKLDQSHGWVGSLQYVKDCDHPAELNTVSLPSGWCWIDNWHIDTSSVNTADGWVYSTLDEGLTTPESSSSGKQELSARQRKWKRTRKKLSDAMAQSITIGTIQPENTLPLPLYSMQQEQFLLQFRPINPDSGDSFCWSSSVKGDPTQENQRHDTVSGLNVTSLSEVDDLLYCERTVKENFNDCQKQWFCATVQASEIAKDRQGNSIQDWIIELKAPLCISNYLPLAVEYSVYDVQTGGNFLVCGRGILNPGEAIKIHAADIRNALFLSMFLQKGWFPVHEAVPISQPNGASSKTMSVRSSITGRTVNLILEQNYVIERPWLPRTLRVYAPYWFSFARCPPLICKIVDLSGEHQQSKIIRGFYSKERDDPILFEINDEELVDGHTIASTFTFKQTGISFAIVQPSQEPRFGPVTNLSPLSDTDESMDLYTQDSDGNFLRLFVCVKPCSYSSLPTKVISVRPFITFTNRIGQDVFLKLTSDDDPKILRSSDSRVSLIQREPAESYNIQVRLEDTEWSYPLHITKEDTLHLLLRGQGGARRILMIEIRGFEEGSRFTVVFRLGPSDGPYRIENRTNSYTICVRQLGFGDNYWTSTSPYSTKNFSWEDPYGQKFIDIMISDSFSSCVCSFELHNPGNFTVGNDEIKLPVQVIKSGQLCILRFLDYKGFGFGSPSLKETETTKNDKIQGKNINAMEIIVELGALGVSLIDHRPKELLYLHMERVYFSYSAGHDGGSTNRLKITLGYLQLDNQLPLTSVPVLLAPEGTSDDYHPVFKMTITSRVENSDGVLVYPYIYIRVSDKVWNISVHEPIIWALLNAYKNLQLNRLPQGQDVTNVDPEIRLELLDISEVRLKVGLETESSERPDGVLGIWSPVLSAIGSAFKIQVHLRRVMHRDRFMRKSAIIPSIENRIWRDLIHNPMHLIFSVDVLGMASSTLSSLSSRLAELSSDSQFLKLRSKQVGTRRITGVREGIMQGTEAFAQGLAFGVSGVVTKPVESATENGIYGLAHGLGRAFLGVFVEPISGGLDFISLTVDGIGASFSKCMDFLHNQGSLWRTRPPRAIASDGILKEYDETRAVAQMVLNLGEATRRFGCTEIFKEPSKFAWSDIYEEHFILPNKKIMLITNKRVMLLQCRFIEAMDKKPSKILWDIPWDEILALELAAPHLIIHFKTFRKSESFLRVIKCHLEEGQTRESQAASVRTAVRKAWKSYLYLAKSITLKVPSRQQLVHFSSNDDDARNESRASLVKWRRSLGSASDNERFVKHSVEFRKIWSSELEPTGRCRLCKKQRIQDAKICSIWKPICPPGYVCVGDVAHVSSLGPNVAAVYRYSDKLFAAPLGYRLVWRNCLDDYVSPVSIWEAEAPEGFVSLGCVAVAGLEEPEVGRVVCVAESIVESTEFEDVKIWSAPDSYPWSCHIYQVKTDALHFLALRRPIEHSLPTPFRISDHFQL